MICKICHTYYPDKCPTCDEPQGEVKQCSCCGRKFPVIDYNAGTAACKGCRSAKAKVQRAKYKLEAIPKDRYCVKCKEQHLQDSQWSDNGKCKRK